MKLNLPQDCKIVQAIAPETTNGALVGDYVSLKNIVRAWIVVSLKQAVAHATAITVEKATNVAGDGSTAITVEVPIFSNLDISTSDALTKRAAAVNYTVDAVAKDKVVVFQVDPATLGSGYDCICVKTAASGQGTNIASALYILENKYAGDGAPSAIVN